MTAPTCSIPQGWTIGEAASALCLRAAQTGLEERALFNWVLLIAEPLTPCADLAVAYWQAVADGRETASVNAPPVLNSFNAAAAAVADAHGEATRRAANAARAERRMADACGGGR